MSTSSPITLSLIQFQRQVCTEKILKAKKEKNVTWEEIAKAVGKSPVWVTSCCLGENCMGKDSAEKLASFLGLEDDPIVSTTLATPVPLKGQANSNSSILNDPCIYRFHEINLIYGVTLKELIQEKFGDGIMSAIDFEMELEKEENPKGDRVKVIMSGKFLPYRQW